MEEVYKALSLLAVLLLLLQLPPLLRVVTAGSFLEGAYEGGINVATILHSGHDAFALSIDEISLGAIVSPFRGKLGDP